MPLVDDICQISPDIIRVPWSSGCWRPRISPTTSKCHISDRLTSDPNSTTPVPHIPSSKDNLLPNRALSQPLSQVSFPNRPDGDSLSIHQPVIDGPPGSPHVVLAYPI